MGGPAAQRIDDLARPTSGLEWYDVFRVPASARTRPGEARHSAQGPRLSRDSRTKLRRLAIAALVGASVVVWPGLPGPREARAYQPPPYERALRWRDIIRLRLSPWLLDGPDQRAG